MFAYCGNNPINREDPSGYWSIKTFLKDAWDKTVVTTLAIVGYAYVGVATLAKAAVDPDTAPILASVGLPSITKKFVGSSAKFRAKPATKKGKSPSKTIDTRTGNEVGRFIGDSEGNIMIEPVGGKTVSAGRGGIDTHTLYPNGSNYQRYNPLGHPPKSSTPYGHGHLQGTGPGMKGQGPSIDVNGNIVPWDSGAAHWPID